MPHYYVGFMPFDSQLAIAHGRTPGSRNGISTTPGYRAIGKLAKDDDYSRAASNKRQAVTKAFQKRRANYSANIANRTGSSYRRPSFFKRAGEFVTGSQARKRVNNAKAKMDRTSLKRYIAAENLKWANRYRQALNTEKANADVSQRINDFKSYNNQYAKDKTRYEVELKNYEKTLPGMIEKAGRKISKIATDSYKKVKGWISEAIGKAKEIGSGLARNARVAYGKARDAIRGAANSTMRKVRGIVDSLGSTANRIKEVIKEAFKPKWVYKYHESKLFKIKTNLP